MLLVTKSHFLESVLSLNLMHVQNAIVIVFMSSNRRNYPAWSKVE